MDILRHLVFENPLSPCIVLGLVAVAAGLIWSRTGSRRALAVIVAAGVAAAVLAILSIAVETDQERVDCSLRMMAQAGARGDAEALIERISPQYGNAPASRDSLVAVVRFGLGRVRVAAEDPAIRMGDQQATVTQTYRFSAAPGQRFALPPSHNYITWEATLAPDADGQWRVRAATAVRPERLTPEEAAGRLRQFLSRF
jgi:hypothetical protein